MALLVLVVVVVAVVVFSSVVVAAFILVSVMLAIVVDDPFMQHYQREKNSCTPRYSSCIQSCGDTIDSVIRRILV